MMSEVDNPPITDRAFATEATTDRAVQNQLGAVPVPMNRRGRLQLVAEMRRKDRQIFRAERRELSARRGER